jgi:hypothetical protein
MDSKQEDFEDGFRIFTLQLGADHSTFNTYSSVRSVVAKCKYPVRTIHILSPPPPIFNVLKSNNRFSARAARPIPAERELPIGWTGPRTPIWTRRNA